MFYNNYLQTPQGNYYNAPQMPVQAPQSFFTAQPTQSPTRTNKIFVTSLEDALNRNAEPNSEVVYLHQDQNLLFEIKTDAQGRKVYQTYQFAPYKAESAAPETETRYATKDELNALASKVNELLGKKEA
jgi:hypothetical protein